MKKMEMSENREIPLDIEKIKMAVRTGIPLSVTTYTNPHQMELYMEAVVTSFLSEVDQSQMTEYLTYCLNELVTNAKKANTKRIYFKEKNLDINNPQEYEKGMVNFKADTLDNLKYYMALQKKAGLYIKLILQIKANIIKIEVRNNSKLTLTEYKRIHDKLSRAQQYKTLDNAANQVLDASEGAGLGLIIMILMLQKIGLTEENFQVFVQGDETITRILLPLSENTQKAYSVVSQEFVKIIEDLPMFPDSIVRMTKLVNDPESKMSEIASTISSDISLSTDLLKLVNSAMFSLSSPCSSIADAVKFVGIRGIKNLIISVASINLLKPDGSGAKRDLWEHAYKTAFYSYNIARNFCASNKLVLENSYVCGLLHDMGKLIFETAHPDVIKNIKKICAAKNIPAELVEKLIAGVNHGEIGALVAEKWNLPKIIVDVIRYHHSVELAGEESKTVTSIVYLSDMVIHYQEGVVDYYQFDSDVLGMFHITSEVQLKKLSEKLSSAFAIHTKV